MKGKNGKKREEDKVRKTEVERKEGIKERKGETEQ